MTRQSYRYVQAVQIPVLFLATILRSKLRWVDTLSHRPHSLRNDPPIFTGKEAVIISRKSHTIKVLGAHYALW